MSPGTQVRIWSVSMRDFKHLHDKVGTVVKWVQSYSFASNRDNSESRINVYKVDVEGVEYNLNDYLLVRK